LSRPFRKISLSLIAVGPEDLIEATGLARQLGLKLLPPGTEARDCSDDDAVLLLDGGRLALQQTQPRASGAKITTRRAAGQALPGPVTVDFGSAAMRHRRRSGQNELLGRAVGVSAKRPLRVLDATAGLGRDSFVLADLGCTVAMCEREPMLVAMLERALLAAATSGDPWLEEVVQRMSLYPLDARSRVADPLEAIDVIYLDPMFPGRDKAAAVKKEMALFQLLLDNHGAEDDTEALLQWALGQDVARVVVKRPPRAPTVGAQPVSHSLGGKAVRFDVYVRRALG